MKKIITSIVLLAIITVGGALAIRSALFPLKDADTIKKYAKEYDVDASLVAAFINFETRFEPSEYEEGKPSGYMNLTDETGLIISKELGINDFEKSSIDDTTSNIQFGTYYLSKFKGLSTDDLTGKWAIRNGVDPTDDLNMEDYAQQYFGEKIEKRTTLYKLLYPSLSFN